LGQQLSLDLHGMVLRSDLSLQDSSLIHDDVERLLFVCVFVFGEYVVLTGGVWLWWFKGDEVSDVARGDRKKKSRLGSEQASKQAGKHGTWRRRSCS
jgi:hypothetical protein